MLPLYEKIKESKLVVGIKRIVFDVIMWVILLFVYSSKVDHFTPPIQLLFFKTLLVSMGFIHAHILRKLAFGTVDWDNESNQKYKKILIIVLYVVIIYAYAKGG